METKPRILYLKKILEERTDEEHPLSTTQLINILADEYGFSAHRTKGVPVICCGEPMQELKAGVTDAAVEKHVPVYTVEGSHVHVVVGETKHPMLEEHFIEWITLNTNQGIYRKQLNPGQEPVADFCLCDGEYVEEVYAYCNLHGFWKC